MNKLQSGRTLLETLAILAIMGIFTVTGMELYARAMNSIRANHLMEKVFLKANEIRNEYIEHHHNRRTVELPKAGDSLSYGYSFDMSNTTYKNNSTIEVVVNGSFSKKMCNMLTNRADDGEEGTPGTGLQTVVCDDSQVKFILDSNFKKKILKKVKHSGYFSKVGGGSSGFSGSSNTSNYSGRGSTSGNNWGNSSTNNYSSSGNGEIVQTKTPPAKEKTCTEKGAVHCDPLICNEADGWFEFEDAPGHCEQCPAGYFCD